MELRQVLQFKVLIGQSGISQATLDWRASSKRRIARQVIEKEMAGTTGLEPAAAAVRALRSEVLQHLQARRDCQTSRKSFKAAQDIAHCGFRWGLGKAFVCLHVTGLVPPSPRYLFIGPMRGREVVPCQFFAVGLV
jgi:hypothetical protein